MRGCPSCRWKCRCLPSRPIDARHVEHVLHHVCHRVLNVRHQAGQPVVIRAEAPQAETGMLAREPGTGLPDADVAHVDTAADPLNILEPLRHLDEPARFMTRRVLEKQPRRVGPAGQARVKFGERGHQAADLRAHVRLIVDDQARQASGEAGGELLNHGAVAFAQHVQPAVQVDHGQARVRGHVAEQVAELISSVGVRLSGEARLGEAKRSQPEQRRVTGYALLEQRVDRPRARSPDRPADRGSARPPALVARDPEDVDRLILRPAPGILVRFRLVRDHHDLVPRDP